MHVPDCDASTEADTGGRGMRVLEFGSIILISVLV